MANIKNSKIKSVKKKNHNQRNFILSMIVAVSMIVSGLYFLTQGNNSPAPIDQNNPAIQYNAYTVTPYNSPNPILVKVNETDKQYIALSTNPCVSTQVIGWVYNISVPGVRAVIMDAANPYNQTGAICGDAYLLFRFGLENPTNNTLPALENELNNRLGNYFMKQLYSGIIMNGSNPTTGKIDVIGNLDVVSGDTVEIIIFQMANGNAIALEKQKIYFGPTVPGKVVSIDNLIARGTINDIFNSTGLDKEFNLSESNINLPTITVNMNLSENLTKEISNITGVTVNSNGNTTEIIYNDSFEGVSSILSKANISYSKTNGSALFQMPANASISNEQKILTDRGLVDIVFKKGGAVALPQTVVFGNITATIPSNGNFTTVLNLNTKVGDNINATLTAYQFGDQVFIAGATQT